MTPVDVLTTGASRRRQLINFGIALACGCWIIWDEQRQQSTGLFWYVIGGLFVVWAAIILQFVLRPFLMRVGDDGITVHSLFGVARIAWPDLDFIDFDRPRTALIGYRRGGTAALRVAGLSRNLADDAALAPARAAILARRPGIATAAPAAAPVPA